VSLPAVGDEFVKQLVAEGLVRRREQGREVERWEKTNYRENHALDAACYSRVAAYRVTNQDGYTEADWQAHEAERGIVPPPPIADARSDGIVDGPAPPASATSPVVSSAGPRPQKITWRRSTYWGGGPPRW
jgi:phage terminase large subunit GpA-like protein